MSTPAPNLMSRSLTVHAPHPRRLEYFLCGTGGKFGAPVASTTDSAVTCKGCLRILNKRVEPSAEVETRPEPEHVTATLDTAANIADRLAFGLRQTAQDHGNVSLANTALHDLSELLPGVREMLGDIYRRLQAERIAQAAGNATSHAWHIDGFGLIVCTVCRCGTVGFLLATGSVPLCTPNPDCPHSIFSPRTDQAPAGSGECLYCKTVYPPTAGSVTP